MSYKRNISNYIDGVNLQTARTGLNARVSPIAFLLSVFSAAFIMLLAIQPVFNGLTNKNVGTSANAAGFFCSTTMGAGMDNRVPWSQSFKDYPLPQKTGRTWTLQESLSAGVGVVNYSGEGEGGNWLISDKGTPTGSNYKEYAAQYSDKLKAERNLSGCAVGTLLGTFANLGLMTADLISGVAQFFATKAFDTELICPDPANPSGSCLNLGKMVGGTGSQGGGIIGALTSSVYMPLLVIAVAIAAGWILHIGLIKRRVREALIGTIWILLSVILGLAFLLNPSLLAKAPISLSNAVSTCVIGAFNGENCMTERSSGEGVNSELNSSKDICRSAVNGASIPESMMLTTNAITCSIWKAFVLEPYAQISFGMTFEDLDTKSGAISSTVKEVGLEGNEFCVDTFSAKSYNQMKGKTLELNGGRKVCNLLAYQMMLKTEVKTGSAKLPTNGSIDDRWYKVVATAAANDAVWSHWSGNTTSGINQIMLSLLAVITSALGSFIIIVTSVFALVYYVSTVMLMAFAPVFLLIGIHPGRGKKILFGWFEKVVSNILKYFVSAVFLVTTLVIYGGILGSATNMGLILMFVIIITMALFLYRQELMNLLGRANMGGEQLSGALSSSLGNFAQGAGRSSKTLAKFGAGTATAMAGGAAGAFIASGGVSVGERLQNTGHGLKDAGKRHLSRQGGLVGNIARQYERSSVDNQRDLRNKAQDAQKEFIDYGNDVRENSNVLTEREFDLNKAIADSKTDEYAFNGLNEKMQEFRNAENETLDDMRTDSKLKATERINALDKEIVSIGANNSLTPEEKQDMVAAKEAEIASIEHNNRVVLDFANYQGLLNEIQEAKMNLKYAEAIGDKDMIAEQSAIIDEKSVKRDELYDSIGSRNASILSRRYDKDLQDHLTKHGIQNFSNDDFENYQDLRLKVKTSQDDIEAFKSRKDLAQIQHDLSIAERDRQEIIYQKYDSTLRNLKPGESLQEHDLNKMHEELEKELMDANLSDSHIESLRMQADEISGNIPDFNSSYLDKVDGRLRNNTGDSTDNDVLPSLDDKSFVTDTKGNTEDSRRKEEPSGGSGGSNFNPDSNVSKQSRDEQKNRSNPVSGSSSSVPLNDRTTVSETNDYPIRNDNSGNSENGQGRRGVPNKRPSSKKTTPPPPFAPDEPMPTPADPNAGNYAEPDDRYAPPSDDEVLPKDSKEDRVEFITRPKRSQPSQNFTPPEQRKEKVEEFNNTRGVPNKRPSSKKTTPPPPFAPDEPMPTPADPNQSFYDSVDDRYAPPSDDEVLPKDSKDDRKEHLSGSRKVRNAPPVARKNSGNASMLDNISDTEQELVNDYFKQQQELLLDDEESLPRGRNEKQEKVRDKFLNSTQEALSRNEELKKVYRPHRSLPTSPNKNKDND